jgi:hypothetical protein
MLCLAAWAAPTARASLVQDCTSSPGSPSPSPSPSSFLLPFSFVFYDASVTFHPLPIQIRSSLPPVILLSSSLGISLLPTFLLPFLPFLAFHVRDRASCGMSPHPSPTAVRTFAGLRCTNESRVQSPPLVFPMFPVRG